MPDLEFCRRLIHAADELKLSNPGKAVDQARLACEAAGAVEPAPSRDDWYQLQSEAWAVLGSAFRTVGDLPRSENALGIAIAFLDQLPNDAVLPEHWARLTQRACYLRLSQRRFDEALELNRDVVRIYDEQGDEGSVQSAFVDRALILARSGSPETAIPVLERCLEKMDLERDPRGYLAAVHNMAYYRLQVAVTADEEQNALLWLERARRCHHRSPEPLGLLQLQAMAALTAYRMGRREQAIESLWQVYRGFGEIQALSEQILTLLHLAACAADRGRRSEVTRIAGLLFPLLNKAGLSESARAALLRFMNAARSRSVTPELVTRVTHELQQAMAV